MMYGKGKVKVLTQKTLDEFNIKFDDLNPSSHKKVYVKCERCDEIFLRERRKLYQLHGCPTHLMREDGKNLKWCNRCKMFLTYISFSKNKSRYDGFNSWCKSCCAIRQNSSSKEPKELTLNKWMNRFLSSKKSRCKKHNIPCNITLEDLQEQWALQDGRCYYSRVKLTYSKDALKTANLDRLDPSLGYIANNIVWASKAMNNLKNHYSIDDVSSFLECSVFTNVRIECKIDHPNARLPFRKRVTDAGHDIHAAEGVVVQPGKVENVITGIRISPPPGWYITVDGRSSLFKEGIVPFRGIIDATYTGPLLISIYNSSNKAFTVEPDDRIAQITLHKIHNIDFVKVDKFSPDYSIRGDAGWGSSGRK